MKLLFGLLSVILAVACFIPYIRDVFKRKTTPHVYSWFLWGTLQIIGTVAILSKHGGYGVMELATGSLFCFFIFFLSFKYGTKNITKSDTVCLAGALLAVSLWIFTKNAFYSVILISLIDFVAFLPTYRKGYEEPYTETISNYFISALASTSAIFALSIYSFTTVFYLATLVVSNAFFVVLLLSRRKMVKAGV